MTSADDALTELTEPWGLKKWKHKELIHEFEPWYIEWDELSAYIFTKFGSVERDKFESTHFNGEHINVEPAFVKETYGTPGAPCWIGDCKDTEDAFLRIYVFHGITQVDKDLASSKYQLTCINHKLVNKQKQLDTIEATITIHQALAPSDKLTTALKKEKETILQEKRSIQTMNRYYKDNYESRKAILDVYKQALLKVAMDLSENNDVGQSNQLINTELFSIINDLHTLDINSQ